MKVHLAMVAALVNISTSLQAATFADIQTVDLVSESITGTLAGVAFTLHSDRASPRPITGDNGGIVSAITDGSSTAFALGYFTPPLVSGDSVLLGGSSDFRITFAHPISNLTLHISQLQSNRIAFTSGNSSVGFLLLSSDGNFTVSSANTTIQGSSGSGSDANGSLYFGGTYSDLSWSSSIGAGANSNTPEDGFRVQISTVPELPPIPLFGAGLMLLLALQSRRPS